MHAWKNVFHDGVEQAAGNFDAIRAKNVASEIWQEARAQDTSAVWRAARVAAQRLREAGLEDVRLEDIPADGRSSATGWLMPTAWDISSARLETVAPSQVLADTSGNPQAIALFSPPTPGGAWIEGPVLQLPAAAEKDRRPLPMRMRRHAGAVSGRFILLPREAGKPDLALNVWAAEHGALGILCVHPGPAQQAAQYLNYAVPLDSERACIPVFALTSDAGQMLRAHLASAPDATVRARVRARRHVGVMPMLTGSLGATQPPVYVCAHIDEIGAQDNASGVAVAIEALRALRHLPDVEKGLQIRFYFSSEVRGQQWWFNHRENPSRFLGGINIDMAGADPARESGTMQLLAGFRHRPHFAGRVLLDAARLADKIAGVMNASMGANYASDALPGLTPAGGHVSIEQKPGPTYHTSDDTPAILHHQTLRWSGVATTAFLYRMTRMNNRNLLRWARAMRPDKSQTDPAVRDARLAAELATLRKAFAWPNLYPEVVSPEDLYAAGVNRTTGLWPAYVELRKLDTILAARKPAGAKLQPPTATRRTLVPLATSRGLVSFEDHVRPADIRRLKQRLNLSPGWGTEGWISMLYACCDGKRTLDEIVFGLQKLGVKIDPERAKKVIRYLVERDLARLRPVLTPNALRAALRAAGVRCGSILTVHASLSRFGYLPGGAAVLVQTLLDVLGPSGTLVMPTHSNSVLGAPPYDARTSPSNTGAVTEYFRKLPGVMRGAHPTHSVAALGPRAAELTAAQRPDRAPMDREGFWGRLCDLGGDVLLLCPIRSATLFHAGETWLAIPQRRLIAHALDGTGKRRVYDLPNAPWHVDHFEKQLAQPLIRRKIMTVTRLGDSDIYFAPARDMAKISVDRLRRNPEICLGKQGACACPYCAVTREGLKTWKPPARGSLSFMEVDGPRRAATRQKSRPPTRPASRA